MSTATVVQQANPFPGLRPFKEDEAHLFFGRENQVDAMVNKLADTRFLAVVGTSGSGKSSLVNCGLRPALRQGLMAKAGTAWRMAQFRPGSDPIGAMARALAQEGVLFRKHEPAGLTLAEIVETTLRMSKLGLIDIVEQAALSKGVNLLVVVDQFEELFRYRHLESAGRGGLHGISADASAFVNLLLEIKEQSSGSIFIVLTMRSDFLGDCTQFPGLAEAINAGQYLVPRLTRDERRAAIIGPVGVGGAEIAPVLLTRLVNDVGDNPDQLSILQHALNRTWARWQEEGGRGPLNVVHYEAIGTMANALDQHAENAYAELTTDRQQSICEKIFKALTDKATDPRGIRRPTTLGMLSTLAGATASEVTEVIDVLRNPSRSFIMPPAGEALEAETVIDISHESLMRVWRRLNTWADEEARSAQTYRRLVDTAVLHGAGKASLWRDPDLTYAREWQEREEPNATWGARYGAGFDSAMSFLRDSEAAYAAEQEHERQRADAERIARERELEQAKALAEAQRQRADEQAAARIRQRRFSWGLGALLVLAVGAALYAVQQHETAEERGKVALSRQLAALADTDLGQGALQHAFLFGAAGYNAAVTKEARQSLRGALGAQPQLRTFLSDHQGAVWKLAFSHDGKTLASASEDKTVILWDLASPKSPGRPLRGHQNEATSVAFSPDDRTLASASEDATVILWDVASGQQLGKALKGHAKATTGVAFSPDGKTLASASEDTTVILWDVTDLAHPKILGEPLKGHTASAFHVAFSPDGKTLASASWDATVILWDVTDLAHPKILGVPLRNHKARVWCVAFSHDGKTLASASGDQTVILWDVADLAHPKIVGDPFRAHDVSVTSVAFSPDDKTLATASEDHTVILWDVADLAHPKNRREPLKGHLDNVWSVAFSPDGQTLASASEDHTVILWDVADVTHSKTLGEPLNGHHSTVLSVAFSPDGKTLASASGDQTVILWDLADLAHPKMLGEPLKGHRSSVLSVAFSPDGKTLASGSGDQTVILWNVADMAHPKMLGEPLKSHQSSVYSVAFSPDGKMLASGSWDSTVMLWDVASRTRLGEPLKYQSSVYSVAFSPDGKTLAAASGDRAVILWDVASRTRLGEPLKGHFESVRSVAFSPDGKTLASASEDKMVILWDVASRTRLGEPLEGHTGKVWSVSFSPDSRTLASASKDKTVILWDVASRKRLGEPLLGHRDEATSLAFSPDGKTLASTSADNTIILREVILGPVEDSAVSVRKACAIANRNLTRREWAQYVGEEVPYQAPCPELPLPRD